VAARAPDAGGEGGVNFALDDRHRSLRRFLMNVLGSPPWTLRTERQPVPDSDRPAGVIETLPSTTTRARTTLPQGNVEKAQTFPITLYPVLGATGAEARLEAERVAQLLDDAITVGLVDDDGAAFTYPERIPVYDYAGVPVKGAQRGGPPAPYGWLWAEDFPVQALQDPEDPLRWSVTCALRVSWEQAGREGAPGVPATGVTPVPPVWLPPTGTVPPTRLPTDPDDEPAWTRRGIIVP
jgi:hypothetical protein